MVDNGAYIAVALIGTVFLAANLLATRAVLRDELSARGQRLSQLLIVWLFPLLGALLVLAVHRAPERPLGRYRESRDGDPENPGTAATLVSDALGNAQPTPGSDYSSDHT